MMMNQNQPPQYPQQQPQMQGYSMAPPTMMQQQVPQQQQGPIPGQSPKPAKEKLPMVSFYPHIYLVAFIIHMIAILVIFIGVFFIGNWFIDLGEDDSNPDLMEDIGGHIRLIAVGGMIFAGGTITRGVAKFYDGQMDMRDRIKF
jgi:hypothetical protein